jgi:hypothetical protein
MTEKAEFFRKELETQVKKFGDESSKHKNMYRKLRYVIFGATGLSIVLEGIAIGRAEYQYCLNIAILITTATIGIVSSVEGLRKPNELWILERAIFNSLKDLQREFEYELAGNETTLDTSDYFRKMQAVLSSAGESWKNGMQGGKNGKPDE